MQARRAGLPILLLAVALVYANSLGNGFHFDDFHTVVDNPSIRSLHNVPSFFTDATTFSVLPANRTYRPLVSLSLALDYALGRGYAPWAFHLGTLLCFLGLIACLFLLYKSVLNAVRPAPINSCLALLMAAWFGLHPAMAETVNYVIQRGDLYCTLGCVTALTIFARLPRLRRSGLYLAPFALAVLSKPPAAVFPGLLFLYALFFDKPVPASASSRETPQLSIGLSWRRAALAVLPALGLDPLLLTLQAHMTPRSFAPSILSPAAYRLTQPYVWLRYIAQLFLPLHLNVDTDLQPIAAVDARVLAGLAVLLALLVLALFAAHRRVLYPITFGLLWFFLTQLPTSLYPLSEVENDHRMFFSFPGLMLAVVWGGYLLCGAATRRWPLPRRLAARRSVATAAVLLLALTAYAAGTLQRNRVWHDEASLWRDDVQKSPGNGRGLMIYGLTRMGAGDYNGALVLFQRALRLTPNYPTLEINLGVVTGALADAGDYSFASLAEAHFRRAIALAPGDDTTHTFYARWLIEHGLNREAIPQLEAAVRLNGSRAMPWELLLSTCQRTGDTAGARRAAEALAELEPGNPAVFANGAAEASTRAEAVAASFWINASLAQYKLQQWQESIRSAHRALTLVPRSPEAWNNIAAAEAGLHEWDVAIAAAREAVRLRPAFALARNNLQWSLEQQRLQRRR